MAQTASLSGTAFAGPSEFGSLDAKKPVLLEFEFPEEQQSVGYVLYQHGSKKIPVQLITTSWMETSPGRPFEFTTKWKETGPSRARGTYILITQGAHAYGFTFTRAKDNKSVEFEEDLDASGERSCQWNRKINFSNMFTDQC